MSLRAILGSLSPGPQAPAAEAAKEEFEEEGEEIVKLKKWGVPSPSESPQPKCTPITLYSSESVEGSGSQIASSEGFVAYAIKGGKVRVLNRHSAARTLLRGQEGPIVDLAFRPSKGQDSPRDEYLATTSATGFCRIWKVTFEEKSTSDVAFDVERDVPSVKRFAWRPNSSKGYLLVIKDDDQAQILSVDDDKEEDFSPLENEKIADARWHAIGNHFLVFGVKGTISLYLFKNDRPIPSQIFGSNHSVLDLEGEAAFASWNDPRLVVSKTSDGTDCLLNLWKRQNTEDVIDHAQTLALKLKESADSKPRLSAPTRTATLEKDTGRDVSSVSNLLILAFGTSIIVLKVSEKHAFEQMAAFDARNPVLSFAAVADVLDDKLEDSEADKEKSGLEICLFCVQTKAISQLHIRPTVCFLPQEDNTQHPSSPTSDDENDEEEEKEETTTKKEDWSLGRLGDGRRTSGRRSRQGPRH